MASAKVCSGNNMEAEGLGGAQEGVMLERYQEKIPRPLWVIIRSLTFNLNEFGSHWKFLSRRVT